MERHKALLFITAAFEFHRYDNLAVKDFINLQVLLRHCLQDVFDGRKAAIHPGSRKIGIDMLTERSLQVT